MLRSFTAALRLLPPVMAASGVLASACAAPGAGRPAESTPVYSPLKLVADELVMSRLGAFAAAEEPPALLSAMEDAARTADGRLHDMNDTIFRTPSHRELVNALSGMTRLLAGNKFHRINGSPSRTLQGAKGIGKTTMLREFVAVCEAAFPNVIPIYVTYEALGARGNPLGAEPLMSAVSRVLRQRDIPVDDPSEGITEGVMVARALAAREMYLLLIVDELDELYKVAPTDPHRFAVANETLYDLQWLGTQMTGRFCTLLCGSSAVTPLLIVGNSAELAAEFPRVVGAPNLNGTKFREWRIPSPCCTDLAVVTSVLEHRLGVRPSKALVRYTAFIGGATVRDVQSTVDAISISSATSAVDFRTPSLSKTSNRTLDSDTGRLYTALLARMVAENRGLCDRLLTNGRIDPVKVGSVPWEDEFAPLTWQQVEERRRRLSSSRCAAVPRV
jgi:hypothetical protein